MRQYEIVFRS